MEESLLTLHSMGQYILYIFSIMMEKNNDVFPVSHYDGTLASLPLIVMIINLCGLLICKRVTDHIYVLWFIDL